MSTAPGALIIARNGGDLHDRKGYPIYPGDLVRTLVRQVGRRRYWLYHVVTYNPEHQALELIPARQHAVDPDQPTGRCWLHQHLAAQCEIVEGYGPAATLHYTDRPRLKTEHLRGTS